MSSKLLEIWQDESSATDLKTICQSNSEGCLPEDEIDRRANAFNAINLPTLREELVSWGRGYR